jgi:hypothetical protein
MREKRASKAEIFGRLRDLLGDGAVNIATEVARIYIDGDVNRSLALLKAYDATIGGIGIYRGGGKKLPGIYRALSYNEIPMVHGDAHEDARFMIDSSCGYLEELIKKLVLLWPWEALKVEGAPLGLLVKRIHKRLPDWLAQALWWLNGSVYVFAKHHYHIGHPIEEENEPEHYFELDEAIAVYYIVRVLGRHLEALSGKPESVFLEGWLLEQE